MFEAVFEQVHAEMLVASAAASAAADGPLEQMAAGFGVFLDRVLDAERVPADATRVAELAVISMSEAAGYACALTRVSALSHFPSARCHTCEAS